MSAYFPLVLIGPHATLWHPVSQALTPCFQLRQLLHPLRYSSIRVGLWQMQIPTGTQVAHREADMNLKFYRGIQPICWACLGVLWYGNGNRGTKDGNTAGPDRQVPQLKRPALPTAEP